VHHSRRAQRHVGCDRAHPAAPVGRSVVDLTRCAGQRPPPMRTARFD